MTALRSRAAALLCSLLLSLPLAAAQAQETAPEPPEADETVAGKRLDRRVGEVRLSDEAQWQARLSQYEGREHPPHYYLGESWLGISADFIAEAHKGLDLLYLRKYRAALDQFNTLGKTHPGMSIGPVGEVLVWQALMLENFDFKFEQQYQTSHRKARQQLEEAIATPGNDGWDYFLLAGVLGIESIHTMRREEYGKALSRGYEAIKAVRKCSAAAPEFIDIELGDGLFDYWATVISRTSKMLPDLEDKREQGIEKMLRVEQRSLFLQPPATLALTFTWIEEGKRDKALASALRNHEKYPKNIINALVLGRVYGYNRKFSEAERIFKEVQAIDPKNERSHYYLSRLYMRQAKHAKALAAMNQYLSFENLGAAHRSYALYYKGQIYFRQKDYVQARTWWEASYKVDKNKRSKKRLEKLDEQGR